MDNLPYFRDSAKKYPTTPRYKLSRNRYRDRYPSNGRLEHVRERASVEPVKPLGMKAERGKRNTEETMPLANDYIEKHKAEPNLPQNIVFKNSDRNVKTDDKKLNDKLKDIYLKRKRRHVGPHDEDGLQRLLSTGTLAPSSLPKSNPLYNNSIDFVFATYWFFPAKTRAVLPQDQKCIEEKLSQENQRFDPKSKC